MSDNYFCETQTGRKGPLSIEALRDLAAGGLLRRSDKVWKTGAPTWENAEAFSELFDWLPPDLPNEDLRADDQAEAAQTTTRDGVDTEKPGVSGLGANPYPQKQYTAWDEWSGWVLPIVLIIPLLQRACRK